MNELSPDTASGRIALVAWLYNQGAGEEAEPIGDRVKGWAPERGKCHDNVAAWLASYPEDRAVRGWLVVTYETPPNRILFYSHSVIERPSGKLIDITLTARDGRHRFIRHPGPEDAFLAAVKDNGLPRLEYAISPDGPSPALTLGDEIEDFTSNRII